MTLGDFKKFLSLSGYPQVYKPGGGGGSGMALSSFFVAPAGYTGAVPAGYTLVTQSGLVARVPMNAGYNIVEIAVGGAGTVNLVANANPFIVDIVDGDGGLSTVAVNKVLS